MNNLEFLMRSRKWSQGDLAKITGITRSNIGLMCRGVFARPVQDFWEDSLKHAFGSEWTWERLMEEKE